MDPAPRDLAPPLERLVVTAALWVLLLGFAGAVIAWLGAWVPLVGLLTAVIAAALAWRLSGLLPRPGRTPLRPAPAAALVVGVLAVTVWTGVTHSEQVMPRRDSASYLQATIYLAETGMRPVAIDPETIGGPQRLADEGLTLESPAFYETGSPQDPTVQPQFMPGPALVYSLPWWAGGATPTLWAPAVLGGLALLAIGLLVARTVAPWAAPVASMLVGVCFPWLHTSRSTYSEPLAGLTLAAGFLALTLLARAADEPHTSQDPRVLRRSGTTTSQNPRVLRGSGAWAGAAVLAGALVGGTSIVRIDALRETMLLIPVAAALLARGRGWGRHLLVGAIGTTLAGFAVAGAMSWRYLGEIGASLVPLVGLVVLMSLLCWWLLRRSRRGWSLPVAVTLRLPAALVALVVLVGAGLSLRPLVMTVRQDPRDPGAMYVARMQAELGLPVDGGRTYAEHSVDWLAWWVGPAALVIALVVLAGLWRALGTWWAKGGPLPSWGPALVVTTGSTLLTLWRPGITPDHPWADRRLLVALPLAIVLAVAGAVWAGRWAGARHGRAIGGAVLAVALAVTAVPTALATWPHRTERVEDGGLAAARTYCDALAPGDVVLAVDDWAVNHWTQITRGMCGVPSIATTGRLRDDPQQVRAAAERLDERVRERGGRLLLVAHRERASLDDIGATDVRTVLDTTLMEDPHVLTTRPERLDPLHLTVWTGRVAR
ncbi:hypothetical protein [Janibacter sp. G368]|uniref:hypothetical protein n=1 Tax=Janibacter sp. G368 TaxID=3420441 RepID=UPI003D089436